MGVIVDGKIDAALADTEAGSMEVQHDGQLERMGNFRLWQSHFNRYDKKAQDIHDPKIWRVIAQDLAEGLINLIAIVEPDVIVVGGGVAQYLPRFHKPLQAELQRYKNPMMHIPPVREASPP